MSVKFISRDFVSEIAEDVISNFDRASRATTPGLKGAARENEIRRKLEGLLPPGVGVGSGCIIDIDGNVSKQQDVVLFEKDICPVFSINETSETTYYPCEGVIAVGEIKSSIGKSEVEDSFSKIASVRKLKRFPIISKSQLFEIDLANFRKYLNAGMYAASEEDQFNQEKNISDQIFGFVMCGDFSVKPETLCGHISNTLKEYKLSELPNLIISLNKGIFSPYDSKKNTLYRAVSEGDGYVYGKTEGGNFQYLITRLHQAVRLGRTVDVEVFERYLISDPKKMSLYPEHIITV